MKQLKEVRCNFRRHLFRYKKGLSIIMVIVVIITYYRVGQVQVTSHRESQVEVSLDGWEDLRDS